MDAFGFWKKDQEDGLEWSANVTVKSQIHLHTRFQQCPAVERIFPQQRRLRCFCLLTPFVSVLAQLCPNTVVPNWQITNCVSLPSSTVVHVHKFTSTKNTNRNIQIQAYHLSKCCRPKLANYKLCVATPSLTLVCMQKLSS